MLSMIVTITFSVIATSQNFSDHAIGLRLGGGNGIGTEVSYQRALSVANRLEMDLGIESRYNSSAFKLTGIYQWVWELQGNFN